MFLRFLFALLIALVCPNYLAGQEQTKFESQVWPIFEEHCHQCHDADNPEGQLRLDARDAFFEGGVSGKLFNRTLPEKSLIIQRLAGHGDLPRMPLDEDPLSKDQISILLDWIKEGAEWPEAIGQRVASTKPHWAYQTPELTPIPPDVSNWSRNAIDHFVLGKMTAAGLKPSPEASRSKLLRRVYLDLIGVPPTAKQIIDFVQDPSEHAYENVVQRLMASPQFGEKWSRSWLDLARYADTNGFQADQFRSVWPYRDWVINSMNRDMPFDQFSIEQLAGDLIPDATVDQKIATGFHRLTTCNVEAGVDPEENRVNQVIDRINTTGTVWFGTTFECMQCHNHKYDPFTQREYYELFAFFNNTPLEVKNSGNNIQYEFFGPKMELPMSAKQSALKDQLTAELKTAKNLLAEFRTSKADDFEKWRASVGKKTTTEKWVPLNIQTFESLSGSQGKQLKDHSFLLTGPTPDKDTYIVTCTSDLETINGFRLEALTDPSLPNNGPGRHGDGRPNFVLYQWTAHQKHLVQNKAGDEPIFKKLDIELIKPVADFSQSNFPVKGLVDNDPKSGWAINPQFGKPHWASVLTAKPVHLDSGDQIEFRLVQNYGGGRTIGRFRISALVGQRANSSVPKDLLTLASKPRKSLNAKQLIRLQDHFFANDQRHQKLANDIKSIEKKIGEFQSDSTLIMVESDDRKSFVFKRGSFLDQGQPVSANTPRKLHSSRFGKNPNRLDFAKWIFEPQNPLTARVTVNRWWAEIFGKGIVVTGEDFGTQGESPTHPELLDFLANEFVQNGWSRKAILKLIVTSSTYRQSSRVTSSALKLDPDNRWLSRYPRTRLSAELIRDNALTISGLIGHKMLGEPIYPPQPEGIWRHVGRNAPKYETSTGTDRYRRGIYVFWRRSAPFPSFVNFDAPDRAACVVNRPNTNTPLQALTLLNDQAYFEIASEIATQLSGLSGKTEKEKLTATFLACTARMPKPAELDYLMNFYLQTRSQSMQLSSENNDPNQLTSPSAELKFAAEKAAWLAVAQILLNLDETITKD